MLMALLVSLACSRTGEHERNQAPKGTEATTTPPAQTENETSDMPDTLTADLRPEHALQLAEARIATLDGDASSLATFAGKALLLVNVASRCGLTPQYAKLEALQKEYGKRGFTVVGFPCNQFGGQEPGTAAEIKTFCATNYGISFPLMEKIAVNGEGRHPIYTILTSYADAEGEAGDIKWNFEKFLLSADRTKITRFRPRTEPDDARLIEALEASL
jgi:glutathione peroxidase